MFTLIHNKGRHVRVREAICIFWEGSGVRRGGGVAGYFNKKASKGSKKKN